ncbi:transcriptional regulator, GntR family [Amycolatopsis marina]|uniref:Transcriptional regulator, GntR family n=1 Tax=Amycolatopsis marina TaxID=490629 RepID=A0A1I1BRM5_9PSEU|nr:FCD domain-containing protein [Amycolatopsis marina]SFB51080.1 transcriptional regulator, GntR family [Amycolatopsis marina]
MRRRISHSARTAMFAPLDQTGRVEAVTRRLVDAITLGLLSDAEQLPSETELASQFGVSTVTVREALMALRQQGLVETRRGRSGGSFVRAPQDAGGGWWRERLRAVTLSDLRDVGDHYVAIAGAAARLAAERSSAEDVERLYLAADDLRAASGAEASRAERHFHLEVAAAAQSPRLTHQEVRLQGELGALLWLPAGHQGAHSAAHEEHRAITEAIEKAEGDLARRLTEEHILEAIDRLAELHLGLMES